MDFPVITPVQFLDADAFNQAIQTLFSNNTLMGSILFVPGLFNHNNLQYSSSGLQVTVDLPSPFAVLFSNGVLAQAHGVDNNADTQSYEVDLTNLVPSAGSVTAYIIASLVEIQQDPFTVTGPPAGHPDYNPNFQPSVAQATTQYSLSVSATTTAPDNATVFELGRYTLSVGQSILPNMDLSYEVLGSPNNVIIDNLVNIAQLESLLKGYVPTSGVTTPLPVGNGTSGTNAINYQQMQNGSLSPTFGQTNVASATTSSGAINLGQAQSLFQPNSNGIQFAVGAPSTLTANAYLAGYIATSPVTFPAEFSGSIMVSLVASTSYQVINFVKVNAGSTSGTVVGNATFSPGGTTATFTTANGAAITLNKGDSLLAQVSSTADATLATIIGTMLGSLQS